MMSGTAGEGTRTKVNITMPIARDAEETKKIAPGKVATVLMYTKPYTAGPMIWELCTGESTKVDEKTTGRPTLTPVRRSVSQTTCRTRALLREYTVRMQVNEPQVRIRYPVRSDQLMDV